MRDIAAVRPIFFIDHDSSLIIGISLSVYSLKANRFIIGVPWLCAGMLISLSSLKNTCQCEIKVDDGLNRRIFCSLSAICASQQSKSTSCGSIDLSQAGGRFRTGLPMS